MNVYYTTTWGAPLSSEIVLHGTSEGVVITSGSGTAATGFGWRIVWTEE